MTGKPVLTEVPVPAGHYPPEAVPWPSGPRITGAGPGLTVNEQDVLCALQLAAAAGRESVTAAGLGKTFGRTTQGAGQTAGHLVRKGLATRPATRPPGYAITSPGAAVLRDRRDRWPDLPALAESGRTSGLVDGQGIWRRAGHRDDGGVYWVPDQPQAADPDAPGGDGVRTAIFEEDLLGIAAVADAERDRAARRRARLAREAPHYMVAAHLEDAHGVVLTLPRFRGATLADLAGMDPCGAEIGGPGDLGFDAFGCRVTRDPSGMDFLVSDCCRKDATTLDPTAIIVCRRCKRPVPEYLAGSPTAPYLAPDGRVTSRFVSGWSR